MDGTQKEKNCPISTIILPRATRATSKRRIIEEDNIRPIHGVSTRKKAPKINPKIVDQKQLVRINTLQTERQSLMGEASKDMTFDDPCNDDDILAEAASTYAYPEIAESASYSNLKKTNVPTMAFGTNGTPMNENKTQKSMLGPINELDQSSTNALLKL